MKLLIKYIPFIICLFIVLHHYNKHKNNPNLSELEKFCQFEDINNHETWALFFFALGIGLNTSI